MQSIEALLADSLDYAGLFPPANLSFNDSFQHYLNYQQHPHSHLLGRFLCPAGKLVDFRNAIENTSDSAPFLRVSLLPRRANSLDELIVCWKEDLAQWMEIQRKYPHRVQLESVEFRLPDSITNTSSVVLKSFLAGVQEELFEYLTVSPKLYYETTMDDQWQRSCDQLLTELANLRDLQITFCSGQNNLPKLGFKLRTGGLDAAAFPSTEVVAYVIHSCRKMGIGWKATAGLHQPLRYFDQKLQAWSHGFLNVFMASVLSTTCSLSRKEIQTILESQTITDFTFTEDELRFHQWSISNFKVYSARNQSLFSFGTCSFEEPLEALANLELLSNS